MGRPAAEGGRCKRHPKHRQSVGVCPFCLREKLCQHLSQTSTSSFATEGLSSSSCSSSLYSDDEDGSDDVSSSVSSPPRFHDMKRARVVTGRLTKSRSLMFAVRGRRRKEEEEKKKDKELKVTKEKFWSKLFGGSSKKKKKEDLGGGSLLHSQTFKEKPSAKWI